MEQFYFDLAGAFSAHDRVTPMRIPPGSKGARQVYRSSHRREKPPFAEPGNYIRVRDENGWRDLVRRRAMGRLALHFLVHINGLARLFRGKILATLMAAHDANQLTFFNTLAVLADKRRFKRFMAPLRRIR